MNADNSLLRLREENGWEGSRRRYTFHCIPFYVRTEFLTIYLYYLQFKKINKLKKKDMLTSISTNGARQGNNNMKRMKVGPLPITVYKN